LRSTPRRGSDRPSWLRERPVLVSEVRRDRRLRRRLTTARLAEGAYRRPALRWTVRGRPRRRRAEGLRRSRRAVRTDLLADLGYPLRTQAEDSRRIYSLDDVPRLPRRTPQ